MCVGGVLGVGCGGSKKEEEDSEKELTRLSVHPISLQLGEHSDINLRGNSPPLSTEIARKVQHVRE